MMGTSILPARWILKASWTNAAQRARNQILQAFTTVLGAWTAEWNVVRMAGPGSSGSGSSGSGSSSTSSATSQEDDVINETLNGSGNFSSKFQLSATQALNAAMKWLAKTFKSWGNLAAVSSTTPRPDTDLELI
jgi:hypothetical protein